MAYALDSARKLALGERDLKQVVMATRREENEQRRPMRQAFAASLQKILDNRDLSHRDLARLCGWKSHQLIYRWLDLTGEPKPDEIFHIERSLELKPGTLSAHFRYKPLEADDMVLPEQVYEAVVDADPMLEDRAKTVLKQIYGVFNPVKPPERD